jgi:hypothetical protein
MAEKKNGWLAIVSHQPAEAKMVESETGRKVDTNV